MTRQTFDTIDVLHLEVERPPGDGELVNLIVNPTGAEGGWGWTSPEPSTFVRHDPANLANWLEFGTGTAPTPAYYSDPMPVTPGHRITGRFRWRGVDSNPNPPVRPTFTILFYDASDVEIGATASYTPGIASAAPHYLRLATVPPGATTARLEVLVTRNGQATNAGDASFLTDVMVTTAADSDAFGLTRTNLVPNPSVEANLVGWSTASSSAVLERVSRPGFPSQWSARMTLTSAVNLMNVNLPEVDVTGGLPYTASIALRAGDTARNVGIRMTWLRADSSIAGLVNTSVLDASEPGAWKRSSATNTAPSDATRLRTTLLYGALAAGERHYVDDFMVEQTDTAKPYISGSRGGENFDYAEPVYYLDVLGPTHEIVVEREALSVGVLSALILDAALDPAQGELIRPGKRVRLRVPAFGRSPEEVIFSGTVQTGRTTYDPRRTDAKRARVSLTAVDALTRLSGTSRREGVGTIAELPGLLEGTGVPWSVNGSGDHVTSMTVVSANDNASALDQVAVTRDSVRGYAWVDRNGTLQARDAATMPTAATVLGEDAYSALDLSYSTDDCINEVRVRQVLPPDAEGRSEEVAHGPFRDQASIATWGSRGAEFTVAGLLTDAAVTQYAAAVLAANATPRLRVNSLTLPVRTVPEVARAAALDLYTLVHVDGATLPGAVADVRVTGIRHNITPDRWTTDLTFSEDGATASPAVVVPPSGGVDGVSYTERVRPIGEVTMWWGTTPPAGWLLCDGSTFTTTAYPKLAAVLGGNVLPNFADRFPLGTGSAALGSAGGSSTHTHSTPAHAHTFSAATNTATVASGGAARINGYTNSGAGTTGSASTLPPYRAVAFIIRAA